MDCSPVLIPSFLVIIKRIFAGRMAHWERYSLATLRQTQGKQTRLRYKLWRASTRRPYGDDPPSPRLLRGKPVAIIQAMPFGQFAWCDFEAL
jgi:hypothetical protein